VKYDGHFSQIKDRSILSLHAYREVEGIPLPLSQPDDKDLRRR